MNNPKMTVLNRFLDFVGSGVPLADARLATLGGQGIEAQVWVSRGIAPKNGWLIERSRERSARLIVQHRFHSHNQLGTFAAILKGIHGAQASVDGFHLDLCGTFAGDVISQFAPMLDLLRCGRGRALAITVADQRANAVFDDWKRYSARMAGLFRTSAQTICRRFRSEQRLIPAPAERLPKFFTPFDPEKGARREAGLLAEVATLLSQYRIGCVAMERYVYVSRYSGSPFRMRTYMFRFGGGRSASPSRDLYGTWRASPLYHVAGETVTTVLAARPAASHVSKTSTPKQPTKGTVTMGKSNARTARPNTAVPVPHLSLLHRLAQAAGGEAQKEYLSLLQDRAALLDIQGALMPYLAGLKPGQFVIQENPAHPPFDPPLGSLAAPEPREDPHPGAAKVSGVRKWESMSREQKVEWTIATMEARQNHPNGSWQREWVNRIRRDFGSYSPKLGRMLRATISRACGKFRAGYIASLHKCLPADMAKQLEARLKVLPDVMPQ